jgi:replicative DNA helicase
MNAIDKIPPHSLESEMSLLGSMLIDAVCIGDVAERIRSEMFYAEKHAALFATIIAAGDDGAPSVDLVVILERLRVGGTLELVGGAEYLTQLVEQTPSAANVSYYADVVLSKWRLRELIKLAGQTLHAAHNPGEGIEAANEILEWAEARLFAITDEWQTSTAETLGQVLAREMDRLDKHDGTHIGIPTHFVDLDSKTLGLQPEELTIIAARPSMGKTALALNLCEQIAVGGPPNSKRGEPVAVGLFSLEMSRSAVSRRILSARSGVGGQAIQSGMVDKASYDRIFDANVALAKVPIIIDDTPGLSISTLRAKARRMVAQSKVGVIVVDYLQLLTAGGRQESRQVEVSAISRGLKALARELKVPVVVLSQLNRASEQREGHRPRMSDLRESGSIEQDADVVILLHREEYYHVQDPQWARDNPGKVGVAELIIAKQRNGPTGVVRLTWDNATTRFKDHDPGIGEEVDVPDFGDTLV